MTMNRAVTLLVLPILLFSLGTHALAEGAWTEVRNEAGILVKKQADESRVLPILLATTKIKGTPDQILAWIRDTTTHTRWMANCEEARMLKQTDEVSYAYNRVGAPWPVSDRDSVVRSTLTSEDGGHRVDFQNSTEVDVPVNSDYVRMSKVIGYWDLRPNEAGGTDVEYLVDSDPGGSLPGWLVAQVASDVPFTTLSNLKRLVETNAKR
jgi:hypothetical protein